MGTSLSVTKNSTGGSDWVDPHDEIELWANDPKTSEDTNVGHSTNISDTDDRCPTVGTCHEGIEPVVKGIGANDGEPEVSDSKCSHYYRPFGSYVCH